MKPKRPVRLFATLAALISVFPAVLAAQDNLLLRMHRESLAGVAPIGVLVMIDDNSQEGGVTHSSLQTVIELRLRQAGVSVADSEYVNAEGDQAGGLRFVVEAMRTVTGGFASTQVLQLIQRACVPSDVCGPVITWHKATTAIAASDAYRGQVRDTLDQLMDLFVNDYLAANPRR